MTSMVAGTQCSGAMAVMHLGQLCSILPSKFSDKWPWSPSPSMATKIKLMGPFLFLLWVELERA